MIERAPTKHGKSQVLIKKVKKKRGKGMKYLRKARERRERLRRRMRTQHEFIHVFPFLQNTCWTQTFPKHTHWSHRSFHEPYGSVFDAELQWHRVWGNVGSQFGALTKLLWTMQYCFDAGYTHINADIPWSKPGSKVLARKQVLNTSSFLRKPLCRKLPWYSQTDAFVPPFPVLWGSKKQSAWHQK